MADAKISALTTAGALAGTEVLPIVQSSTTKKVAVDDLTVKNVRSNASTGVLQIAGPGAGTTRTMTVPNANFTAARTDAGQSFNGINSFLSGATVVQAGVNYGGSANFVSGSGTFNVTGANARGIGVVVNSNSNQNVTLPYGGSFEILGFVSAAKAAAGGGYGVYGVAGYAESDGVAYGVRADALNTTAGAVGTVAYGVYVGAVSGAENNYGIYVADTSAKNYLANNLSFASGKGIDFSATPGTGTSELLADYEEGTWTPTITFNTPGDLSVAYDIQAGRYTKIGNRVVLQGVVVTSTFTHTTASSFLKINGLPFAASEVVSAGPIMFRGILKIGYTDFVVAAEPTVTSALIIYASASGTFTDPVVAADMPTGGTVNFRFTITYQA